MGFPLPADPDVQTLAYYLVAIPDAVEYKRAVIGHFGELGNARVWGEEGITPDSFVAAQAWLRALNETWELLEMGWPQQILAAIDGVEALLAILQNVPQYQITCCNGNQTFSDPPGGVTSSDPVPQAVVDAGYATSTSDYAGYGDYKCMVANLLINNFQAKTLEIIPIVVAGAAVLSVLLVLFGATSGLGALTILGLTVGLGELLTLIDVVKDLTATDFQAFAQDLEDNREDLVCAIMSGDGINGSIAAYKAKLDELFTDVEAGFFKLLNVNHMFQHYLAAAYGDVDVAAELAAAGFDPANYQCVCTPDGEIYGLSMELASYELTNGNQPAWAMIRSTGRENVISVIQEEWGLTYTNSPGDSCAVSTADGLALITADVEREGIMPWANRQAARKREVTICVQNGSLYDQTFAISLENFQAFFSNDGGETGDWAPCTLTLVTADAGWSFSNQILTFSGTVGWHAIRAIHLTVDGEDPS